MIKCNGEYHGGKFSAYSGDCTSIMQQMPGEIVDFTIFSIPFLNVFVYSDSAADLGNCSSDEEFYEHYAFIVREMFRLAKPGTLCAVHCSDLPLTKFKDGEIGLKDFPGMITKVHTENGWIYHSKVVIWRDPVVEVTRTKALGLLHKQVLKDSSKSRVGIPDYVCVFRKPGLRDKPIGHNKDDLPVSAWQKLASPVWFDVNQTYTINSRKVTGIPLPKGELEERHVCPLQIDVIENALFLWSNPNDIVLSPFMGVGSEGFVALKNGRRFCGVELKPEYYAQACRHLEHAERNAAQLFSQVS